MARKDALLRLHDRLIAKRDSLRSKLIDEMGLVGTTEESGLDVGETANAGEQSELHTQLAALESRELRQIERAIEMIREGRYGLCEHCNRPIPVARLQALPYTAHCVDCQREQESLGLDDEAFEADWETACEFEGRSLDRDLTIGDLDISAD